MKTTTGDLPHIPVEFVVGHAQAKKTDGQRRPFVELVKTWAEHEKMDEAGEAAIRRMTGQQKADAHHMPKEFYQLYRAGEKAEMLIQILRKIEDVIQSDAEMWTWAHVMRVMVDENILMAGVSPNRFDTIVCSLIPGKGKDTVRKNGDYSIMRDRSKTYRELSSIAYLNPQEASDKEICRQIAQHFAPIIMRR